MIGGGGLYLYTSNSTPEPIIVVTQPKVKEAPKFKPAVILKAFVTVCEKLTVTIPLDAGILTTSDDVRVMKGYVENRGNVPVHFVKLQLIWRNGEKRIMELDEIYSVTETPLMPGEKSYFQSTKRNILIEKCNVKVTDWWVYSMEDTPDKTGASVDS